MLMFLAAIMCLRKERSAMQQMLSGIQNRGAHLRTFSSPLAAVQGPETFRGAQGLFMLLDALLGGSRKAAKQGKVPAQQLYPQTGACRARWQISRGLQRMHAKISRAICLSIHVSDHESEAVQHDFKLCASLSQI